MNDSDMETMFFVLKRYKYCGLPTLQGVELFWLGMPLGPFLVQLPDRFFVGILPSQ
jgi:hypothetical protein